jgi:hypothetical protein
MWSDDVESDSHYRQRRPSREEITPPEETSDAIWKIVAEIEEGDVVYNLLKRTRDSLSFDQICQKIAEMRGIDWHDLRYTGFLNVEDMRLSRLDNGHFALSEWLDDSVSPMTPPAAEIDNAAERECITPTIDRPTHLPPPPVVNKGRVAICWAAIRRVFGWLMRLIKKR